MNRVAPLLLATAALALAGLIALELRPAPPHTPLQPARAAANPSAGEADPLPADRSAELLARPLFTPGRRPAAVSGGSGPQAGLPRLSGVLVGPFGRTAIFAASGAGKPIVLAEGGEIGGFRVVAIAPGQVTLTGKGRTLVLSPSHGTEPAERPPAPARTAEADPPAHTR